MSKKSAVLFLLGLVLLGGLVTWLLLPDVEGALGVESFPHQIGSMEMTGPVISGQEAIDQISKLHGLPIELADGYIATYAGQSQMMQLWISVSNSEEEAAQLIKLMDEKMPQNQVFSNYRVIEIDGKPYYYVTGIGMEHVYYQSGKKAVWIGIQSQVPGALENAVRAVNEIF